MNKEEIIQLISDFNAQPSNPEVTSSRSYEESYHFVSTSVAAERASFIGWLLSSKELISKQDFDSKNIVDLAFGSGSLTSQIILQNDIKAKKIILNDKNLNTANISLDDQLDNSEVYDYDFLSPSKFDDINADVLIFNPQLGGGYTLGESDLSKVSGIYYDGSLDEYLKSLNRDTSKITFKVSEEDKIIYVQSLALNKGPLKAIVGDVKIFNYYDVIYQSKNSKPVGEASNNVKFRRTFDRIFSNGEVLIFYGDRATFDALFVDFNDVRELCASDGGMNLFVAKRNDSDKNHLLFKESDNGYNQVESCKESAEVISIEKLYKLEVEIGGLVKKITTDQNQESPIKDTSEQLYAKDKKMDQKEKLHRILLEPRGKLDFQYKNILLKGVPGTGKSRQIDIWIDKKMGLEKNDKNVLRVNIHSASSNADLMQGIGINTKDGSVEYKEKKGLILKHIIKAILHPNQPFVIILEEIQENSLNELIGDLIYLIESSKRVNIGQLLKDEKLKIESVKDIKFTLLINSILEVSKGEYVELPKLLSTSSTSNKMILPDNLYIFCTSNYRDDKKVIEDNLLRRFEVIEIYPKQKAEIGEAFKNQKVSDFVAELNQAILKEFNEIEIHPDRFLIGHAIWLNVEDQSSFCRAMLKVITEFKDIKELEYSGEVEKILRGLTYPFDYALPEQLGYMPLIEDLQAKGFKGILE